MQVVQGFHRIPATDARLVPPMEPTAKALETQNKQTRNTSTMIKRLINTLHDNTIGAAAVALVLVAAALTLSAIDIMAAAGAGYFFGRVVRTVVDGVAR